MIHEQCRFLANGSSQSSATVSAYEDKDMTLGGGRNPTIMLDFQDAVGASFVTFKDTEAFRTFIKMLQRMDEKL